MSKCFGCDEYSNMKEMFDSFTAESVMLNQDIAQLCKIIDSLTKRNQKKFAKIQKLEEQIRMLKGGK